MYKVVKTCTKMYKVDFRIQKSLKLTSIEKSLIKRELNEFKSNEMQIHPTSRANTQMHFDKRHIPARLAFFYRLVKSFK